MEKLKSIPVVGYFIRWIVAIFKLPFHVRTLYNTNEMLINEIRLQKEYTEQLKHLSDEKIRALQETMNANTQFAENIGKQIQMMSENESRNIEKFRQDTEKIRQEIDTLCAWNKDRMQEIRNIQECKFDISYSKKLNRLLSITPTIWGDENRLHISELASVDSCLFNTNSGYITIGAYTFASSGVSILAGTHNIRFSGLARRDAERQCGCDIIIGEGVWLGANCTILGPAVIEDNAVIAAGAVVVPNTRVLCGTVYAGIPASCLNTIDFFKPQQFLLKNNLDIFKLYGDEIFVEGWKGKENRLIGCEEYEGHQMIANCASFYTHKEEVKFKCFSNSSEGVVFDVLVNDERFDTFCCTNEGIEISISSAQLDKKGNMKISVILDGEKKYRGKIFVSII